MIIRNRLDGEVVFIGRVSYEYARGVVEEYANDYTELKKSGEIHEDSTLEEHLASEGIRHKDMETLDDDFEDYDEVIR